MTEKKGILFVAIIFSICVVVIGTIILMAVNFDTANINNTKNNNSEAKEEKIDLKKFVTYFDGGNNGRLLINGEDPEEVEKIIAQINKNGCDFKTEGGVKKRREMVYYASGPIGLCGKNYNNSN